MLSFFFGASSSQEERGGKKQRKKRPKKKKTTEVAAAVRVENMSANDDSDSDDSSNEDVLVVQVVPNHPANKLTSRDALDLGDPISITVDAILRRKKRDVDVSFTREQVSACVMEMWDEGQAYDDPDAVLQRLLSRMANVNEQKVIPASSVVSSSNKGDSKGSENGLPVAVDVVADGHLSTKSTVEANAPVPHQQQGAVISSLPSRLEAAASHTDLVESLTALCSWAALVSSKALGHSSSDSGSSSSGDEVDDVAAAQTRLRDENIDAFFRSRCLEILFLHMFSHADNMAQPGVRAGLSSLLLHLFRPVLGDADTPSGSRLSVATSDIVRCVEALAAQLHGVQELKRQLNASLAGVPVVALAGDSGVSGGEDGVAQIVRRVCQAVRQARSDALLARAPPPPSTAAGSQAASSSGAGGGGLEGLDEQLARLSADMAALAASAHAKSSSTKAAKAASAETKEGADDADADAGVVELQWALDMREMAADKLDLLLQSLEGISQAGSGTGASAPSRRQGSISASHGGDDDALGEALLADVAGGGKAAVAALRASLSVRPSVAAVSSSALLGQQMERLQAETHSCGSPLLHELEASARQVAALLAKKEALERDLRALEVDLAATTARSQALQASTDEIQAVYEQRLQSLLATHTPTTAAPSQPAASEAIAAAAASLEGRVAELLGDVRRVEAAVGSAFRPAVASRAHPTDSQALSAAAAAVSARVALSAGALSDYVEAEGRCLWALADRLTLGRTKLAALRAEEEAFRRLDMQGMLQGIAQATCRASAEVGEDERAVVHLQSALVQALQRYKASVRSPAAMAVAEAQGGRPRPSSAVGQAPAAPLPAALLQRAVAALQRAGCGGEELAPALRQYSPSAAKATLATAASARPTHARTAPRNGRSNHGGGDGNGNGNNGNNSGRASGPSDHGGSNSHGLGQGRSGTTASSSLSTSTSTSSASKVAAAAPSAPAATATASRSAATSATSTAKTLTGTASSAGNKDKSSAGACSGPAKRQDQPLQPNRNNPQKPPPSEQK